MTFNIKINKGRGVSRAEAIEKSNVGFMDPNDHISTRGIGRSVEDLNESREKYRVGYEKIDWGK